MHTNMYQIINIIIYDGVCEDVYILTCVHECVFCNKPWTDPELLSHSHNIVKPKAFFPSIIIVIIIIICKPAKYKLPF